MTSIESRKFDAAGAARARPTGGMTDATRQTRMLPVSLPPRGLSRLEAAAYVGVSPSLFDAMVKDGRMPQPKRINTRTMSDRIRLDESFEALPGGDSENPWDEAVA